MRDGKGRSTGRGERVAGIVSRRGWLAAAATLAATRLAQAGGDADDLLARIARARLPVRAIRGPFTQTRAIGLLATDVRSHGTMTLVRPDRLRWDLTPPDDVTFWIGPEGLAYRSAHGTGRVPEGNRRITAALDDIRSLLGGDLARLRERWSLSVLRDDANGAELEAAHKSEDAAEPRTMRFSLAPDLVRPTRVVLVEGPRDHTNIEFGELTVNGSVDDGLMRPPV